MVPRIARRSFISLSEVVALSVIDTRVDRRERLAVFSGALDLVDARGLAVGPHLRDPEVGLHLLQILTEMQGRWEHRTDDSQRVPACDDHHFVGRPDPVPGPLLRRPQGGMAGRKLQLLQVEVEDIAVRHDVRRACGRPRPRCQITRLLRPGTAPVRSLAKACVDVSDSRSMRRAGRAKPQRCVSRSMSRTYPCSTDA